MEPGDPGAGGVAEDAGQASPGAPGGQGGPGDHEDPGRDDSGEAGAVPRAAAQAAPALQAPVGGSDAETAAEARTPSPDTFQFSILVPFRSAMEAEIASHLMTPGDQTHPGVGHQDIWVSGTQLAIRLTADDTDQLRLCISACFRELLLVIRTMQHILPPAVFLNPNRVNQD